MAMDYITEKQENKYQEYKQSSLLREAAIHVITGMSTLSTKDYVNLKVWNLSESTSEA